MHGSKEIHMGYIYRRSPFVESASDDASDPFFARAIERVSRGFLSLHSEVKAELLEKMSGGPRTRSSCRSP